MPVVQLSLGRESLSNTLRQALLHDQAFRDWKVKCVTSPDLAEKGVIVVDAAALDHLACPLPNPERVVLIAHKDQRQLRRAWDAGIVSVVDDTEPVSTAMLAILAARFRAPRDVRRQL